MGDPMLSRFIRPGIPAVLVAAWFSSPVPAQDASQFFNGKTIDLYVGFDVGGGYDLRMRLLARHMGKHIPGNPTIVPKNMEGAGSLRLANWLANVAPKDGTAIGMIARGAAFDPIIGQTSAAQFKGTDFGWIGSTSDETNVCAVMSKTGVAKFEDVLTRETIVGSTGLSDSGKFPLVLNGMLGSKFKLISGYKGTGAIVLAMERGEVEGRCGWNWSSMKSSHQNWLDQKIVVRLLQFGLKKHPELQDVPLVIDLAKNEEQKEIMKAIFASQTIGWPFLAPPGISADRLNVLRRAFQATMEDKDFLAEAGKAGIDVRPLSGEQVKDIVTEVYSLPPELAAKAAALLNVRE
jgi:tripartite-type tricarboxylate transporter receptor subunit TctC